MFNNLFHRQNNAFGLEIGNTSVKVLELKKLGNRYKLSGRRRRLLPKGAVANCEIQNEDLVAETIKKALRSAEPKAIKSKNVIVSLPENKTFVKIFSLPKLGKNEQEKQIITEVEKYIPLSISEVYFDWQIIKTTPESLKIFLAASQKKFVDSYQNTLFKAGLSPQVFDLEAAAEARALIPEKSKNKSFLICDIGESKTLLIVSEDEIIPFSTSLTEISGNAFTKTVAKNLKLHIEKAEKLKITCCSPKMSEQERKTLESLHSVLDKLSKEIEKILDYYQNHFEGAKEVEEILLCGGGAGIVGIAKYLALKLKKKVKLGNPWINIPTLHPALDLGETLAFTKTIGLAARGINI